MQAVLFRDRMLRENFEIVSITDDAIEFRHIRFRLVIEINFYEIVNFEILSNFNHVRILRIERFFATGDSCVQFLFQCLTICYMYFDFIPKYNFIFGSSKELGFEITISASKEIEIESFLISISDCLSVDRINNNINFNILSPSYFLHIIQTNTKTRRIGYLKLIISLFERSNYFPISFLNKKIELESSKFSDDIQLYGSNTLGNSKGLIKVTSSGISAKPYTDLLEEMNLITRVNNSYILTKQSKIYFILNSKSSEEKRGDNLFILNEVDRLFFLRQILSSDFLYIIVLLDVIKILGKATTSSVKNVYQLYLLDELERIQNSAERSSFKRDVAEIKKRIKSWSKPKVYLEHIVEPRINWLLDLNLVSQELNSKNIEYSLSIYGERFLSIISCTFDFGESREVFSRKLISSHYFKIFDSVFNEGTKKDAVNLNQIENWIKDSFSIFQTSAPNRIAASQAIDYVSFKSYFDAGCIIEFDEVKELLGKSNKLFTLDWFSTESDGALYFKNN